MNADTAVTVLLLLAAAIHLPPVLGVLGVAGMERAYGTAIPGPDLAILMRHRAVLFGLLGGLMVWAAFEEDLQAAAVVGGLVSDVAFAGLCWAHRDHGAALGRVLRPDVVSVLLLLVAGGLLLGG